MSSDPTLWFLNRASGITLLVLLSGSVVLGVLALGGRPAGDGGARVPRFLTRDLHRNLALGSVVFVLVHAASAIADEFVDIRWWHAVVPWGSGYHPITVGLGTLAFDLMLLVALTSGLRHRLGPRTWRNVHLTSWLAWGLGVGHGVLVGTDLRSGGWQPWSVIPTVACVVAVGAAGVWRLRRLVPTGGGSSAALRLVAPRRSIGPDRTPLEVLR